MNAGIFSSAVQAADVEPALPAGLAAPAARCLRRFFRWGAAPTVDGYCELFGAEGTLLDADMEAPISGAAIRAAITRVLSLLPDFRFAPLRVVADGPHAFVLAANRATLGERPLVWHAVYALTIAGDRIAAGRRYYDRTALLEGREAFGAAAPTATAGAPDPAHRTVRPLAPLDLAARTDAWHHGDVAALVAPCVGMRLHMAGVGRPLDGSAVHAALVAFLDRAPGLRLAPGVVVQTADATAIEWVGSVGPDAAPRRFALVELHDTSTQPSAWHLLLDTFGL